MYLTYYVFMAGQIIHYMAFYDGYCFKLNNILVFMIVLGQSFILYLYVNDCINLDLIITFINNNSQNILPTTL